MSNSNVFAFDQIDRRTRQVTPALIAAVTERIAAALNPKLVILFGSQANKKAEKSSDIDLLICLDDEHPIAEMRRNERAVKVLDLFRYRSFGLDVLVVTESEVRTLIDTNKGEWDLVLEIVRQGEVLYERRDPVITQ